MDEDIVVEIDKIDRIEVINHFKNARITGRVLVLTKELNDFEEIDISLQDDGKTLKIFLK